MATEELRCYCHHKKGQHALGEKKCDFCSCSEFRMFLGADASGPTHNGDMCVTPQSVIQDRESAMQSDSGLKDSGQRLQFESGMVRDIEDNKPGFQFLIPKNVPFEKQMITRVADHLRKGAKKYAPRNWEKGNTDEEAERARESALRHMMQWIMGETDEDHAAAIISNVIFAETMQYKADKQKES